jgi:KaiC/GvpD/RAD55 family RecA-like ATPase
VIIEEDRTDRPLVDELIAAGIPRERIVLAYIGEAPPATET